VSGEVILLLSEATSLREVTLHLRGKARIPSLGAAETQYALILNEAQPSSHKHPETFFTPTTSLPLYIHMIGISLPETDVLTP
jgi:hypothetical protein